MSNPPTVDWRTAPLTSPMPWDNDDDEVSPEMAHAAPSGIPSDATQTIAPGSYVGTAGVVQPPEEEPTTAYGWPSLCCLAGPCRHYLEIAQVSRVIHGREHRTLYRYCRLLSEEAGTMSLREQTIRTCSGYTPPLLSLDGWKQRLRMSGLQERSIRKFGGTASPTLWLLRRLADALGYPNAPGSLEDDEQLADKDKEDSDGSR